MQAQPEDDGGSLRILGLCFDNTLLACDLTGPFGSTARLPQWRPIALRFARCRRSYWEGCSVCVHG